MEHPCVANVAVGKARVATVGSVLAFIWNHPANRGRRAFAVGRAVAWQMFKRVTGRHWDIRIADGVALRCYPDSRSASSALYTGGRPDYHEMEFMAHFLRPGDGFVDVGANIGVYALLAASFVGQDGRVDAFEPVPIAFDRLRENVALNGLGQVHAHQVALGASAGTARITVRHDTMNRITGAR